MGIWTSPWAKRCVLEGHRFWFYSLLCSILLGLMQIFGPKVQERGSGKGKSGKKGGTKIIGSKNRGVKGRLVSDCFDLLIPGHVTGWIKTSAVTVGFATVVSTVLSAKDIWDRLKD
jgi:hypothetical protein